MLGREEGAVEIGPEGGFGGAAATPVFASVPSPRPPSRGCTWTSTRPTGTRTPSWTGCSGREPRADVGQTGEKSWHVPADPEGNPSCLLHTRLDPL